MCVRGESSKGTNEKTSSLSGRQDQKKKGFFHHKEPFLAFFPLLFGHGTRLWVGWMRTMG